MANLSREWELDQAGAAGMLGCDTNTLNAIVAGDQRVEDERMRERLGTVLEIRATLDALFRDLDTEKAWLREGHDALDGRTPLQLITEGGDAALAKAAAFVWHIANPGGS